MSAEVPDTGQLQALASEVAERLLARAQMLASAESCTGGLIAKLATDLPGSSRWFDGGIISYSNRAKQDWLGVAPTLLDEYGAVSAPVVLAMAEGLLRRSAADWTVAVSGIAGPDGGSSDKPVGTVWIAWAGAGLAASASRYRFDGTRDAVRRLSAAAALTGIRDLLGAG